jgi:hypothetical protein
MGNLGALLKNWANMMAKHPLMEAKIRFIWVLQELAKLFIKLIAKVRTMFVGITSNPSMYTPGEFGGVIQELVQHYGQTSPNGGENQIHMSFEKFSKTIL